MRTVSAECLVLSLPIPLHFQRLATPTRDTRQIGQILLDLGRLSARDLQAGLALHRAMNTRLGDTLIAEGLIRRADLYEALAEQHGLIYADLERMPVDPDLAWALGSDTCLENGVIPWRRMGNVLFVATDRPDMFDHVSQNELPEGDTALPVLCDYAEIRRAQDHYFGPSLALQAETQLPAVLSSRDFGSGAAGRAVISTVLIGLLLLGFVTLPILTWGLLAWVAIVGLVVSVGLKIAATTAQLRYEWQQNKVPKFSNVTPIRRPKVSVIVPLFREQNVATALVKRLSKLTYPKALLDVLLVLEADDTVTADALKNSLLPPWMRIVTVPQGSGLRTKPRALNYALPFCQGSIVGIWDAEDAPDSRQIETVVQSFQQTGPDVACLQGRLDYYNAKQNWISRCFTIEYATWWRLVMPGLSRLGFVIPLGGTTLFFRRDILENIGAWDAHNVTEDADLGLRLARAGYRTEMIDTTTMEEATARVWPWVRQRSRWLKGFAITWAVHMRHPRQLLRDLGLYRFVGLQLFFISSLSPFLLAPVFWSFWLIALGIPQPFGAGGIAAAVVVLFLLAEVANTVVHVLAVRRKQHRHLILWTPIMTVYFLMGCAAIYKALLELITRPYFWDKTQHGMSGND